MRTALQHVRKLTDAQRVAAAEKAYGLVQLRKDYAVEYRAGMDDHDRGLQILECPYLMSSKAGFAWVAGWRESQRQEGD